MEDNAQKRIGSHMLIGAWVLILAGLVAFFGSWEKKQYNPNQNLTDEGESTVVLQRNRMHHYVASGIINQTPVVFLLDTGATEVVVPEGLARRIGLKPGQKSIANTANGTVQVRQTMIDTLQLGSITLRDVRASINPGMSGEEILLGMSALKDLEFTQSGDTLTLRQLY